MVNALEMELDCVILQQFCSVLKLLHEAGREESSLPRPLQGSFVPPVFPFLVHVNDVTQFQFNFDVTLWRVWHDATESAMRKGDQANVPVCPRAAN